jgi:hypothetical protein
VTPDIRRQWMPACSSRSRRMPAPRNSTALLFLLTTSALLLPSFGTAAAANEKVEIARKAFYDCQIDRLAAIDVDNMEERSAALELTNLCLDQYRAMVKAVARHSLDNSNERRMFSIDQASDYAKIDASLAVIVANR